MVIPPNRVVKEVYGKQGTTYSAFISPSAALSACVRAYVTRNTLEADLALDERRNQFPPTPTCIITWVIRGHDTRIDMSACASTSHPRIPVVFSGPHTQPSVSDNPGPVQLFSVLIYPDAIRALTGLDISLHLDRYSQFCDVFDGHWQEMAHSVLEAMNDGERLRLIENFLVPRWQAVQPTELTSPSQFHDWSHGIARRAADKNRGLGDRQVDRRIKSWTGQALRQLRGIGRAEESLFHARKRIDANNLKWSEVAAKSGYSDQAHMCREFRRITGLRPKDFKKMITHESYWLYQVWSKIPLSD